MKRINFCLFIILIALVVTGCYDPKKYSSEKPVDFVYVNNSDYKINALLLDWPHASDYYDSLINKTTINLEPGEKMTVVTDKVVNGSYSIFAQYFVVFNDTEFFYCFRKFHYGFSSECGWDENIPLYPTSYKILPGTNENGHTVYEFTFTNAHYDSVMENSAVSDVILTDENGKRYFQGWERYKDGFIDGMGVVIDGLAWSPFDWFMRVNNNLVPDHRCFDEAICPTGWRLPTADEFKSLATNHSKWGEERERVNSVYDEAEGMWFSGTNEYSADIPAIHLSVSDRWSTPINKVGKYWTSTKTSDEEAIAFTFSNNGKVELSQENVSKNCLVRCIKSDRRKYY